MRDRVHEYADGCLLEVDLLIYTSRLHSLRTLPVQCTLFECISVFYCCSLNAPLMCAFGGAGACTQFENFDARAQLFVFRSFINTPHSVSAANSTDCISCEQIRGCCVRIVLFDAQNQILIIYSSLADGMRPAVRRARGESTDFS